MRLVGRGLGARHRRLSLPLRVDGGGEVLLGDLPRSGIEQRSWEGEESRQHHSGLDGVPLVQVDAGERSGNGGRDRVALANARAAVIDHLLVERRPNDAGHIDVDRVRAQSEENPREQRGGEESGDDPKRPFHGGQPSVASLENSHEIEPVRLTSHDEALSSAASRTTHAAPT